MRKEWLPGVDLKKVCRPTVIVCIGKAGMKRMHILLSRLHSMNVYNNKAIEVSWCSSI